MGVHPAMLKGDLLANRLYELFGPVSIWSTDSLDDEVHRGLNKRGVAVDTTGQDSVLLAVVEAGADEPTFSDGQQHRYWAFYCSEAAAVSRRELDARFFARGMERAPITTLAASYDSLDKGEPWWAVYQRRKGDTKGFLSSLTEEAEALLGRYSFAAGMIRPGDSVLVVGVDHDGPRFMSEMTSASAVSSIGPSEVATGRPATDVYDVVVDIEHGPSSSGDAISAAIRPAGILVTIREDVPEGTDLAADAIVWQRTYAPRGMSPEKGDVAVATFRKPYIVAGSQFRNKADVLEPAPAQHLLDFDRYYVYPNAIRAIANKQHRTPNVERLREQCLDLLANVSLLSADAGEALCVLSYASERFRFSVEDKRVSDYLRLSSTNPHVIRWQISLAAVRADACMLSGEFERALANLDACLSFDASRFHLSILTKQVGACIKAAHICAIADEEHKAAQYLQDGAALGRKICAADPDALFGTLEDPRFFHYGELAEVLSLSSRCAFGYEQWRRGGRDALRMALASSTDLFRAPRAGDLRDMALQNEIIGRQSECIRILQATTGMGFCERLARMALRLFKGKALARSRRK